MALKILEDKRSKLIVAAMIPFTSCPARFVVFAFLEQYFQKSCSYNLILYLLGIFLAY